MSNKQDRKTQRLFDNVTKSLLTQNNGLKRDPETGILYEEPLKEEHPVGSLLLLRGAGPAAAKGIEFIGEKMMPSALLKGIGQTFPKLSKVTTAISPYADAGLLAAWGAQGSQSAKEAAKSGDAAGAIAGASMAALPLMGIRPNLARKVEETSKVVKPLSRPISEAERLGIPKGERSNLTQDQLEALDDLVQFNKSGKYKTQLYIDDSGKIHWGRRNENQKTFIQEAAKAGLGDGAYGANGVRFRGRSPYYNGTITVGYDEGPKMTAFALDFPTDYGSATFSATPHKTGTLILTSPRSDFYDHRGFGIENEALSAGESLPNTISKDLMKNYWTAADDLIQPGTYLSGDTGQYPIGIKAIRDIRDNKGMTSAISKILYPELQKGHANGLSVDSYSSIIRQGQRPGKSLRWGDGFTKWNASGIQNKEIFDAWTKMNKGEITPEQYKEIFDAWAVPLGGRPVQIRETPSFRTFTGNDGITKTIPQEQKKFVIMPHPYIYYQKQGGILKQINYAK